MKAGLPGRTARLQGSPGERVASFCETLPMKVTPYDLLRRVLSPVSAQLRSSPASALPRMPPVRTESDPKILSLKIPTSFL